MYAHTVMLRPQIDLTTSERKRVEEYAEENGLRNPRAYADLIRKGLDQIKEEE